MFTILQRKIHYNISVKIPFNKSLEGHSDADVGFHCIVDSILGAIGKGDIGDHFPPSDPKMEKQTF